MRVAAGLMGVLMAASTAGAQEAGTCASGITIPADAGMRLAIGSRSSGMDIEGTDAREIRVTCTMRDEDRADEVHLRLSVKNGKGELRITGGPSNNLQIRVEVPRQTHLWVRMPAGAVHVKDVNGDKDIDVHAGEVQISGVNPDAYQSVHAAVEIGEVRAKEYDVAKGGFFRSVERKSSNGLYRLDAHIITGSIHLN